MIKKTVLITAMLIAASCTNVIDNVDSLRMRAGADDVVFYATIEGDEDGGPETKVYADDQMRVLWNANDLITIFNNNTFNQPFRFTGRDGRNAGSFGMVPVEHEFITSGPLDHIYAIYPYQESTEISYDGDITFTLPALQTYKKNSFGIGANTMVSVTDNTMLQFKNAGGYLEFKLYGEGISVKRIQLRGNNGEKLAGDALITMPLGGLPTVTMQDNATEEVTLECETPVALGTSQNDYTVFWFVLPPTSFTKGITVTVTDALGGTFAMSTSKTVTVQRSYISHMAPLEVVPVAPTHQAVDLGLPSGLLWATCNVGANNPEEYGDYFAWGETEPKSSYTMGNYRFNAGDFKMYNKYNTVTEYGIVDSRTCLEFSDDAANTNWGGKWRMPTEAEVMELRNQCDWQLTTQGGTNGWRVTSKTNGNSIFLPAAGFLFGGIPYDVGTECKYWSSSLDASEDGPYLAWIIIKSSYYDSWGVGRGSREYGCSVRPVYGDPVTVSGVSLDRIKISLAEGKSTPLVATVLPANAGEKGVIWSSDNPSVASVSTIGLVTANQIGDAVITATSLDGGFEATCLVTVSAPKPPEYVDLGLSVKWATFNVGANSPAEYGDFFAWGETTPKNKYNWNNYKYANGDYNKLTKYCGDSSYGNEGFSDTLVELQAEDDAAHANWGGNWRMPTIAEWWELFSQCDGIWTTQDGSNGYRVTGPNGNSIFLPAAGRHRDETDYFHLVGSRGEYWSSSLDKDIGAVGVFFSVFPGEMTCTRGCGLSVRPVYDENPAHVSVDLGLPSGLKWATCNVGASSPEGYGDYFAWGETAPKNNYGWESYELCNGSNTTLTRYNNRNSFGTVDNKTEFKDYDYEDDAARQAFGGNWRIPTDAEWTELREQCTWTWTTQNGVNGTLVTSKTNGNSIFLPAAGHRSGTLTYDAGSYGAFWSSSLNEGESITSWDAYFNSDNVDRGSGVRCLGFSIRPVTE